MHLRMLPDHRNKKYFLTSIVVKNAHASRPPEKKIVFNVWSGRKRVLMHFRMLPDHQKHGLKKDVFLASGVVKTVF
jgi:hypothetical protein